MDKISIIVPVYNIEKYIEKCVKSIEKQTYKNLEIILVDDGATDKSGKICDKLATKDERIKVIHKKNGGLSSARNEGIKNATGNYICFIDGDDYVSNDYCELMYNALIETNSEIAVIAHKEIRDDNTKILDAGKESKEEFDNTRTIYQGDEIIVKFLREKHFRKAWNKLYKAESIKGHFFKDGAAYEDICFTYYVLENIKKAVYINTPGYFYVRRGGSISTTYSQKNLNDFADSIIELYDESNNKFPQLAIHVYYALLQLTISICMKYVTTTQNFNDIDIKLKYMFKKMKSYTKKNECDLLPTINAWYKICLYAMCFDRKLFYKILLQYQKMQEIE